MLDIARLSHGDNAAIIADIEDTVLLEDWAEHVLDNDRGRGVRDKAGLLVELLGEEIDTQVAVLAGLSRSGDTDDLARTPLEDKQVADADMVAGDGYRVWPSTALDIADAFTNTLTDASWAAVFLINDNLLTFRAVAMRMERVENTISCFFNAVTEGVVTAFFVIIAHFGWRINSGFGLGFDFHFFTRVGAPTLVLDVVGWLDASAVVTLGDVDLFFAAGSFDINLGFAEALVAGLSIAMKGAGISEYCRGLVEMFGCRRGRARG